MTMSSSRIRVASLPERTATTWGVRNEIACGKVLAAAPSGQSVQLFGGSGHDTTIQSCNRSGVTSCAGDETLINRIVKATMDRGRRDATDPCRCLLPC
jgi:hypothetical protein